MENISDIENFNIQPLIIEFLNNTLTIHDSKVYKLKKYYYDWASKFLKLDSIQDLKIGSNKNKKLLFFNSVKESDKHLILKLDDNTHFIYIKDCVDMMWKILNNKDVRGIFNVGTGKAQSWNNIACAIFKVLGQDPNIEYLDMPSSVKDQYQYFTQADMSKLKETSVFTNDFSLELAVKDYIKVYLETNQHYL